MTRRKLNDDDVTRLREWRDDRPFADLGVEVIAEPNVGDVHILPNGGRVPVLHGLPGPDGPILETVPCYSLKLTTTARTRYVFLRTDTLDPAGEADDEAIAEMATRWETVLWCEDCDSHVDPDDVEDEPVYGCPSCDDEFTREDTEAGDHRSPCCGRFGRTVAKGIHAECGSKVVSVHRPVETTP